MVQSGEHYRDAVARAVGCVRKWNMCAGVNLRIPGTSLTVIERAVAAGVTEWVTMGDWMMGD